MYPKTFIVNAESQMSTAFRHPLRHRIGGSGVNGWSTSESFLMHQPCMEDADVCQ